MLNGAVDKKICECKQCKDVMSFLVEIRLLAIRTYFEIKRYVTVKGTSAL